MAIAIDTYRGSDVSVLVEIRCERVTNLFEARFDLAMDLDAELIHRGLPCH